MPCTHFTIYGERCSGTNYLEELLLANFDIKITWDYGWKHFFGFHTFNHDEKENNTLFLGLIRNELNWLNSFYRDPHHLPQEVKRTLSSFLFGPFYSIHDNGKINRNDLNFITNEKYKNIFDMRAHKLNYLKNIMPTNARNYALIVYDDLINNHDAILSRLQQEFGLTPKHSPFKNILYYKKTRARYRAKKNNFTYNDIETLAKKRNLIFNRTEINDDVSHVIPQ